MIMPRLRGIVFRELVPQAFRDFLVVREFTCCVEKFFFDVHASKMAKVYDSRLCIVVVVMYGHAWGDFRHWRGVVTS